MFKAVYKGMKIRSKFGSQWVYGLYEFKVVLIKLVSAAMYNGVIYYSYDYDEYIKLTKQMELLKHKYPMPDIPPGFLFPESDLFANKQELDNMAKSLLEIDNFIKEVK